MGDEIPKVGDLLNAQTARIGWDELGDEIPKVGDLLNAQTARIGWDELARHFARGVLVRVAEDQDLLKIAALLIQDDTEQLEPLFASGAVARAVDTDAERWVDQKPEFWAVVVAPWVLVQEIKA